MERKRPTGGAAAAVPAPAHVRLRREPLPWQQPKPAAEDPNALERVQAILRSPNYPAADEVAAFLQRDDVRGVRLEMDYL